MKFEFELENDEGEMVEYELPAKFEVCGRCEGHGSVLNPSMADHAYSMEEFNEEFDEEDKQEYFKRGGIYDVQCPDCNGNRVAKVVDEASCTTAELKKTLALFHKEMERQVRDARERAAEMRMGY